MRAAPKTEVGREGDEDQRGDQAEGKHEAKGSRKNNSYK
jgi:hypothetical protein